MTVITTASLAPVRLNLGCSDNHVKGWVNVDIAPPADKLADLSDAWPWETSSVDEIRAHDILEHLPDITHTMNEAWRVLKRGGRMDVFIPTTDGRGAFQDPTHRTFWNRNTFLYFTHLDPHRERFGEAYGIQARFKVIDEEQRGYSQGVIKLRILLEAVK